MQDTPHSTESTVPLPPGSASSIDHVHSAHDSALSLETVASNSAGQGGSNNHTDAEEALDDTSFSDNDSAFGGSFIGCDTDTLASYITDYRYENGRRYHAYRDGEYWVIPEIRHTLCKC
jgi:hypothetical protein